MKKPEPIELENNLGPDAVTGEINRVPWMAYDVDEMDLYIAELEQKLAEKDKEIESLKASHYAESVDAGMRERRLRRALWLARAERAEAEHAHWATIWFCDTTANLNINKSSVSQEPYKSNTFRNASEWRNTWYDIASKCLKKAEEYK